MTDMNDNELNTLLAAHDAPNPSELLKARILKQAQKHVQTSPNHVAKPRYMPRKAYMSIAASLIAVGTISFTALQSSTTYEAQVWQETATELGFDEIYDWVESDASEL